MACKHCFGLMNETEPSEVLEVFKQLKWLTNSVNLAGGEVFLNIDLLHSLIKQAVKDHLQVSIITNGLKLLNHLDDERVTFILKHIYQLGLSIDSFKEQTNRCIGRTTLDMIKLKKLVTICNTNRVKVKINTVVSQKNMNEVMVNNIIDIHPNSWKIIQVFSQDNGILVNTHQFRSFIDKNKTDAIDIKIEKSEGITESYAMINGHGKLFLNSKVVDGFDLIPFTDEFKQKSSLKYSELLMESGFDQEKYFSRYTFNPQDIKLDVKKFIKKAKKRVIQGTNVLFIDVEGITARPHQSEKYPNLTMGFKPVLYTGIILNENLEIVDILSDYLNPKDEIIKKLFNNDKPILSLFYKKIATEITNSNIGLVVSSATDSEKTFFQEMIYYGNLNRKEYEYISELMNNIFDIQSIKTEGIVEIDSHKIASRNLLQLLNDFRSDLFGYVRNGEKDLFSSGRVSNELVKIYLEPKTFNDKLIEKIMSKNVEYCLEDVYDDLKLFKTYWSMTNLNELHSS